MLTVSKLCFAVMDPTEIARWDQVVDMDVPQRGTVLCLVRHVRLLTGDRGFESISLQQTVCLSSAAAFEGREPGFPRGFVCADGLATASAETPGCFDIALSGGNVSVGPNSSTAVRLM